MSAINEQCRCEVLTTALLRFRHSVQYPNVSTRIMFIASPPPSLSSSSHRGILSGAPASTCPPTSTLTTSSCSPSSATACSLPWLVHRRRLSKSHCFTLKIVFIDGYACHLIRATPNKHIFPVPGSIAVFAETGVVLWKYRILPTCSVTSRVDNRTRFYAKKYCTSRTTNYVLSLCSNILSQENALTDVQQII